MANLNIIGFAGSWSQPSKTRALVTHAVAATTDRFRGKGAVFDIADLGPSLGVARRIADLSANARDWLGRLQAADAIVLGSPVFKGSYTGLFKHVIDLLDPSDLRGKPVLLVASGGGDRHALVVEHQLRPLLGFFEAATLPTGVYGSERDFADGRPASPALLQRLDTAVAQFGPWLDRPAHAPATRAAQVPLSA